jgi:hypothetical protein
LNTSQWQPIYDAVVNGTNCTSTKDTLAYLKSLPVAALNNVLNGTAVNGATFVPVIDGEQLKGSTTASSETVNLSMFLYSLAPTSMKAQLSGPEISISRSNFLPASEQAAPISPPRLLPSSRSSTLISLRSASQLPLKSPSPDSGYGQQWKSAAAYAGDQQLHSSRHLTCQSWATNNVTVYSYHFNVVPTGLAPEIAVTHFQEVAFVFHDITGKGYSIDPFANKPPNYPQVSTLMSRMWINFVNSLNPNHAAIKDEKWPA